MPQPPSCLTRIGFVPLVVAALAGGAVLGSASALAQVPTPELLAIFPPGGQQGTTVEVTLTGANQDDATQLVFSHPGIVGQRKMATGEFQKTPRPVTGTWEVTIAGDVPTGLHEARVVGRWGISNPRAFAVGRLEEAIQRGSNTTRAAAQSIRVGVSVNGRAEAAARDYYRLTLKQQQRVLIECYAERIDSRMDATLVVLDAAGRELARNRDSVGRDPLIDFTAPTDGEYTIQVFDDLYRGGAEYFYRLNVHDGPSIDYVFPPCGLPGATSLFAVYGRNLPDAKPAAGLSVEGALLQMATVNIALPGDAAQRYQLGFGDRVAPPAALDDGIEYRLGNSNPVRLGFAQAPIILETEPNDDPAQAQLVSVPCEYVGQFYPARDVDWVRFDAKAGDVYWIEAISHRLGLDTDPCLLVQKVSQDPAGREQVTEVASVDDPANRAARIGGDFDTSTDDPAYRLAVAADATYRVMVRDQFGGTRSDPRYVYRLVIRREQPDFRLLAIPALLRPGDPNPQQAAVIGGVVLQRGGSAVVEARADRRDGFAGELELSAEDLPPGVTCSGAILGGAGETAWLVFTANDHAAPSSRTIRILGKARIGDRDVTRYARGGTCVWGTANRQQTPPIFRATRDLCLSVTDKFTAPVSVQVGDGQVVESSLGATFELPVKVVRRGDFKGDVALVAVGATAELKPADVTIKGDAVDGKIAFSMTKANTSPGSYTFYWKTDVKHPVALNEDALQAAEQEQKEVAESLKAIEEQVKTATDEKNAAANAAPEVRQQAEQKLKETQEKHQRANDAKQAIDRRLADLQKSNAPKELTTAWASTPIKLRLLRSPFEISVASANVDVKQGDKAALALTLAKRFGFDDQVDITLEPPNGVSGLSAEKLSLEKGQTNGKLELTIAPQATTGRHVVTIRARSKFNNVNVEAAQQVTLNVTNLPSL